MFSALAEGHGNFESKINIFLAMAPIVYMGKTTDATFKEISSFAHILHTSLNKVNIYEIFGPLWRETSGMVCMFFSHFCDSAAITNVPITPYINEY